MTASDQRLDLAAGFPPADLSQWRDLVAAVLTRSGTPIDDPAAPERSLAHVGYDGYPIAPLYTAADLPPDVTASLPGFAPFVRGSEPAGTHPPGGEVNWEVRQQHRNPDPSEANRAVLADLENGVSSLWLALGPHGLVPDQLEQVLRGVYLDLVSVVLDAGKDSLAAAQGLLLLTAEIAPGAVRGNLGGDPIGLAARTGTPPDLAMAVRLAELADNHPALLPIMVDASIYHEAGGSDSDELAVSLAVGVAYLRALTEAGRDLATAFGEIEFRYAVTANQFDSIAKLRAARMLWDRVGQLSGLDSGRTGQRQHAVTSAAMMTRRDPWVNILRTTIGCFAAAVGGAQAITVAPFDSAIGLPDDFGLRIARNTHAVLHDESSLARVADPAGGSFYVESITAQLAETAWNKFTELERRGGAVAALASGAIADLLERSWQARRVELAHRRDAITGVSEFAMLGEAQLTRRPLPDGTKAGLPRHRYAEPFERLRDRSDAMLARTGARPKMFLAGLGPATAHTGRVGFVRNLLEVGGIEAVLGTGDPQQLAAAFAASGASTACLCGADESYRELAAPAVAALRAAGARLLWIAGKPAVLQAGIDAAVYVGCDAVLALQALHDLEEGPA